MNALSPARSSRQAFCLLLATILVLPALAPLACAQEAGETRHMLWQVTSEEGTTAGYLVGSVHVMKEDAYPLGPAFDDAFAKADVLAFEANQDSMQAKAKSLVRQLALYSEGKTLESELSDETYAMLEKRTEMLGLNLAQMQRLEPWMMSMTIPTRQMQKAGYSEQQGLDRHFFTKAKDAGKPIVAFETAEEQLRLFDSLPPEKQEDYLRYSLEKADRTVENIDKMVRYWKNGNAEGIEEMMVDQMKEDTPALYEMLITERNESWMAQITELLASEKRPMVVVGAGHVVGENGLVAMLEAKGHQVQQL